MPAAGPLSLGGFLLEVDAGWPPAPQLQAAMQADADAAAAALAAATSPAFGTAPAPAVAGNPTSSSVAPSAPARYLFPAPVPPSGPSLTGLSQGSTGGMSVGGTVGSTAGGPMWRVQSYGEYAAAKKVLLSSSAALGAGPGGPTVFRPLSGCVWKGEVSG